METPKAEAYKDHPRWVVEYPLRWCQSIRERFPKPRWVQNLLRNLLHRLTRTHFGSLLPSTPVWGEKGHLMSRTNVPQSLKCNRFASWEIKKPAS